LALEAAKAIVEACKGHHVGVSVIDSAGTPKLYYIPDGTDGSHAYTGFRKAYTALTFKMPTSQVGPLTKTDPSFAAKGEGGYQPAHLCRRGCCSRQAIGSSERSASAAPSEREDEECGLVGIDKIKNRLK